MYEDMYSKYTNKNAWISNFCMVENFAKLHKPIDVINKNVKFP